MSSTHSTHASTPFLEALFRYGEGWLEIRPLPGGSQTFVRLDDPTWLEQAATVAGRENGHRNVYFGCAPRSRARGQAEDVAQLVCLWCDVDAKDVVAAGLADDDEAAKALTVQRLRELPAAPTAIVDSGNGVHAYWRLDEPMVLDTDEAREAARLVLRRVAITFTGDLKCVDPPRVLRVPGTRNLKRADVEKWCRLVWLDADRETSVEDLAQWLHEDDGRTSHTRSAGSGVTSRAERDAGHASAIREALDGEVSEGGRNDRMFRYAAALLHQGHRAKDIEAMTQLANEARCKPPLDRKEIKAIVRSVLQRYKAGTAHEVVLPRLDVRDGHYGVVTTQGDRVSFDVKSNWTLRVNSRLILDDGADARLDCTLRKADGRSYPVTLSPKSLADNRGLMDALPDTGLVWLGGRGPQDISALRLTLDDQDAPERHAVGVVGRHVAPADGRAVLVLPDETWDARGPAEPPPLVYHDDRPLPFALGMRSPVNGEGSAAMREFVRAAAALHDPTSMWRLLGWAIMVPWAPVLRAAGMGVPIALAHGTRGGGKTTIAQYVARALGWAEGPVSVNSTAFSWVRLFSGYSSIPIHLDEYKPAELTTRRLDDLHHKLRGSYNGAGEVRGFRDQSVESYRMITPVLVTGESHFSDAAMLERSIVAHIGKSWIGQHPEAEEANAAMQRVQLDLVAGWLHRRALAADPAVVVSAVRGWGGRVAEAARQHAQPCQPRVAHNVGVVLAGLTEWGRVCAELEIQPPKGLPLDAADVDAFGLSAVADALQTTRQASPLERFAADVAVMISTGALPSTAGRFDGDDGEGRRDHRSTELLFHLGRAHAAWAAWCHQRGWGSRVVDVSELRTQMREDLEAGAGLIGSWNRSYRLNGQASKVHGFRLRRLDELANGGDDDAGVAAPERGEYGDLAF